MVVGSTTSIAKAVEKKVKGGLLRQQKATKLLGTDSGGGRKRAAKVQQQRVQELRRRLHRYQQLRQLGVNTRIMARTQAAPALMHGVDVLGMSDSRLTEVSSLIARVGAGVQIRSAALSLRLVKASAATPQKLKIYS